jgi:Fuc2NAc and GlcNAc transferase
MIALIVLSVSVASCLLTGGVRKYALANQMLDVPNQRSSHTAPTPSGGGAAIVLAWLGGVILLAVLGRVDGSFLSAMIPPTVLLAVIGFIDDQTDLSPWVRLATQLFSAAWFVLLSGVSLLTGIAFLDSVPLLSIGLGIASLVWLTNLYNFMDGIDGLAGGEGVFVALGIALFCWLSGAAGVAAISLMLAAACMGFLVWNWPPARIFMGDTGSSWVGFILGAIAMTGSEKTGITIWPWVILLGVFIIDATVTLLRRLVSGQTWYEAHHSHAYQNLSRRWGAHRPVTVVVCLVNVGWLLPLAAFAYYRPDYSGIIAFVALAPLVVAALFIGAGNSKKLDCTDTIEE